MADEATQAQPFHIFLLSGPYKGQSIALNGRALPYQGVEFETEQRINTTYYTGNPVATQQVFGPVEKNTVITGAWKDIFLGNGTARRLGKTFRDVMRVGTQVKVSWGAGIAASSGTDGKTIQDNDVGPYVRVGLIKRFKQKLDRPQDLMFEIEFEWAGSDEQTKPLAITGLVVAPKDDVAGLLDKASDALAQARQWVREQDAKVANLSNKADFSDLMDDIEGTCAAGIGVLSTASDAIDKAADLPGDIAERVSGTCLSLMEASDKLQAACGNLCSVVADGISVLSPVVTNPIIGQEVRIVRNPTDDALAFLDDYLLMVELLSGFAGMALSASYLYGTMQAKVIPEVMAELVLPAGTDLRDVAKRYYGDPDLWWQIADYNGLDTSRVPNTPLGPSDSPGWSIQVPQRSTSAKPYGGAGC